MIPVFAGLSVSQFDQLGRTVELQGLAGIPGYFNDMVGRLGRELLPCDGLLHGIEGLAGDVISAQSRLPYPCRPWSWL